MEIVQGNTDGSTGIEITGDHQIPNPVYNIVSKATLSNWHVFCCENIKPLLYQILSLHKTAFSI